MSRKFLGLLIVASCATLFAFVRNFASAEETPNSPALKQFDGLGEGILMVSIEQRSGIEAESNSSLLKNARLVKVGDRYFVRGKGYVTKEQANDKAYKWFQGLDVAYALDDVTEFYTFTPEGLEEYMAMVSEEE